MNMYAYVGGDPINNNDPSGLNCYSWSGSYVNVSGVGGSSGSNVTSSGTRVSVGGGSYCGSPNQPGNGPDTQIPTIPTSGPPTTGSSIPGGDVDCSPPVNNVERQALEDGNLGKFWESRHKRGDPWALVGRGIWSSDATQYEIAVGAIVLKNSLLERLCNF